MSKSQQFAMEHPDADQLTAFAEHALPAHEREQTLAHLAVCGVCREVVFLAQEVEPVEVLAPALPSKPWFAGWNLVWPALAALAGIVAVTVHLRTVARPPERVTMADAVTVTAPPVTMETQSSAVAAAPRRLAKPVPIVAPPQLEAPTVRRLDVPPRPGVSGAAGVATRSVVVGGAPQGGQVPQQATPLQNEVSVENAQVAPAPMPKVSAGQLPSNGRNAMAMAAPVAAASQTVEVTGAAAVSLEAQSANASEMIVPMLLPSHLAAISTGSSGKRSVAVDSGGGVFVSGDGGRHWKAVKTVWDGRALAVRMVDPGMGVVADTVEAKKRKVAAVFALRTDAGGVWVSVDGKKWTRE